MTELSQSHEQAEIVLASEEEVRKFRLHFADRPGDDAGSNDHTRAAVAAMLAAEHHTETASTLNEKWDIAYTAMLHYSVLNELAEGVSSDKSKLTKQEFDKYYDALWRMHEMRTTDA